GVDPRILDAIEGVKASDYPGANSAYVLQEQSVVYQSDGQFEVTVHNAQLVLTSEGKSQAASASLYYAKDAERMEVLSARVIKRGGAVVEVAPSDIQDVEQSGEANIYDPQGRALRVTFPSLAIGDVTDISYRLTRALPTRPGFFNDSFWFQSFIPVLWARYEVDGPSALPLTSVVYRKERAPKLEASKTAHGDRVHYRWSAQRVPQLVPELSMNYGVEMPIVVVTTDPSWEHFSQWWAQLTEPQLEATPALRAKVAELTRGAQTDDAKVKALYDFVAQDIRYRGLGVGPRTGYTPRKAEDTYTSRWGVCRDVAILLTSMLRASGLSAYPVLTNVGEPVLDKVAYDAFNHAIVAMPKAGGGWTYLDPTAKNNNALLPGNEAEQDALVSTLQGEPLRRIPALDPSENLGRAITQTTLHADGSMTSKARLETKGLFDLGVRSIAAQMRQDQQRDLIESILHDALPDARLVSFELSNPLALWEPMTVKFEVNVPNAAHAMGQYQLAQTLVTSGALGIVEAFMPRALGALPERKYGLDARFTFRYDQEETVTVPESLSVAAFPNAARADSPVAALDAGCTQVSATTFVCKRSFQLKSRFINPSQYLELRKAFATLDQIARQPVILTGGSLK
ncbi:MAG TPA: DUF3857 and transglutaminase domain-containing protein, partial [Polyangiaceae bacterium]|nr:DUF3857 and transglutaminase domain-containing protein [Polyangiaceae bacterium]